MFYTHVMITDYPHVGIQVSQCFSLEQALELMGIATEFDTDNTIRVAIYKIDEHGSFDSVPTVTNYVAG